MPLKKIALTLLLWFVIVLSQAQYFTLSGVVLDEQNKPLPGCHVHCKERCHITNFNGEFAHNKVSSGEVKLTFSFIGYQQLDTIVNMDENVMLKIKLQPENKLLNEVYIKSNAINTHKTQKNEVVNATYIEQNLSGTLLKTMERLSGVNSMDIGANASKPIIRGMGFQRVVVSENGVKQEGQQWGADHGLEIDAFSVETAEVVKGASAIELGSDAIGGYINISNNSVPEKNTVSGDVTLLTKSVNATYGGSFFIKGRSEKKFLKLRVSALDFGDYKVPTDQIVYLTREMPVYNGKLKNTAGNEHDFSIQVGHLGVRFKSTLQLSSVNQKSGFFPGAHGVPDIKRIQDGGDSRNIGFPYQKAHHLKVLNQNKWFVNNGNISVDLGFQNNVREEWSEFHTHYPDQPVPKINPNREFDFNLKTYSANAKLTKKINDYHKLSSGFQVQHKDNDVGGYNFLLPKYQSTSLGVFVQDEINLTDHLNFNVGIRFDHSSVKTNEYFDPILYDYFISEGEDAEGANNYALRSVDLSKHYGDVSWLLGLVYTPSENFVARMNVGKAFRTPTAVELASNGIHHGSFRHEMGDENLKSEKGYYIDGNLEWISRGFSLEFSPYMYYFSNYLFLKPSGDWSLLPHAGQIYRYSQSEAILSGFELSITKNWFNQLGSTFIFEYIYNQQVSSDKTQRYPLPFTPPVNGFVEFDYSLFKQGKVVKDSRVYINSRMALAQNRVCQNEETTDGYVLLGIGVSTKINVLNQECTVNIQGSNLLNTKYYNHVSFYRKVEIPEPGRNIQLLLKVPF